MNNLSGRFGFQNLCLATLGGAIWEQLRLKAADALDTNWMQEVSEEEACRRTTKSLAWMTMVKGSSH